MTATAAPSGDRYCALHGWVPCACSWVTPVPQSRTLYELPVAPHQRRLTFAEVAEPLVAADALDKLVDNKRTKRSRIIEAAERVACAVRALRDVEVG